MKSSKGAFPFEGEFGNQTGKWGDSVARCPAGQMIIDSPNLPISSSYSIILPDQQKSAAIRW
jgi:hypothetical protein